ncbi:MAG: dihydrolipoyl dehydrogenase [Lachnospiraceae bacterium]|nr:dihydrolipoyl dehydrogenase [Lachnospiraceae bacterium]
MSQTYDIVVIGAGPGGYEAAIKAAQLEKKVALIEKNAVGGTCLNRGCIPTKALMHSAHLLEEMKNCEELGIKAEQVSVDFGQLHERKSQVVGQLQDGICQLLKANKIDLFQGKAVITEPGQIKVTTEEENLEISADKILIATGSVPSRPPIPGLDLPGVVTSDEILEGAGKEFSHLIIIGGGVIGIELATVYEALGTKVTVIEAMKQILPNLDKEISRNMAMILKKKDVDVHTGAMVKQVAECDGGLAVTYEEKGKEVTVEGDGVLVSIGRRANIEGLFEGEPLVETERGAIVVDENFKTSVDGIYAIGDAVYRNIQLAHVASAQGISTVCHMFGVESELDLSLVPSCIYTSPEIAAVGMTADQAKEAGIAAKESKFLMSANGKSLISREERSFIKVLFEEESHRIIGANMMCARATDMISEFSLAIEKKMTLEDMASIIRPHPTYAEGITEAVEAGLGCSIHSAPARKPRK